MKAIILEDEHMATKRLIRLINEVAPDVVIVATFETIEETANFLLQNSDIDLLFLDIHVADGKSFELFKIVEIESSVIFTTAYDQYAIEAFRKSATDYLLKPIKKEELIDAISKATPIPKDLIDAYPSEYKNRILVKFMAKLRSIKTSDIAYIYSKNKFSYFVTNDGERYPSDYKLQELEEKLDPRLFFRANRQFIVHIDSIIEVHRHQASRLKIYLEPTFNENIVISTDKTPLFKLWLDR